jgi:hypothetical protein
VRCTLRGVLPPVPRHLAEMDGQGLAHMRNDWRALHGKTYEELHNLWSQITEKYSERILSRLSDKLVALLGIASEVGESWKEMKYFGGHLVIQASQRFALDLPRPAI